jgi:AcrR family transcriptional regulator
MSVPARVAVRSAPGAVPTLPRLRGARDLVHVAPPRRRHLERTRQDILSATSEVVNEVGYQGSRIEEICSRAGISRGAFYHHFPSKEAAIVALVESHLSVLVEEILQIEVMTVDDQARTIALEMAAAMRWVRTWPTFARAYLIDMMGVPEAEVLRARFEQALEARMREHLEPLFVSGELTSSDPATTVRAFSGMTKEAATAWVLGRVPDLDLTLREVVRLALIGVGVARARADTLAQEAVRYASVR